MRPTRAPLLVYVGLVILLFTVAAVLVSVFGRWPGGQPTPPAMPSALDRPIMLWYEGQPEAALAALEAAPWSDPKAEFSLPLLVMTESQFVGTAPAENDPLSREAVALAGALRELGRRAIEEIRQLSEAGDRARAERLLSALGGLADRLAEPERRLAIITAVGESMQKRVLEAKQTTGK